MRLLFSFFVLLVGCSPAFAAATAPVPASWHTSGAASIEAKTVALVAPDSDGAYCSGVWIANDAILTAQHCVDGSEDGAFVHYVVRSDVYPEGSTVPRETVKARLARIQAQDKAHDLALIRVANAPPHLNAALAMGPIQQGSFAQTIGQSLGLLWWSYSSGDVAAVRTLDVGNGPMKWVQTTTPISPGNSGGGLFDAMGDLIGICHGHFTRGENLNIFVHLDHINEFLRAV